MSDMKLIMENWRVFLKEEEEQVRMNLLVLKRNR